MALSPIPAEGRTGRFLQRDPSGYSKGPSLMEYAGTSPANSVDPSGLAHYAKVIAKQSRAINRGSTTGFQRALKFQATDGKGASGLWIRQEVTTTGTVWQNDGTSKTINMTTVEYFRLGANGVAKEQDTHSWSEKGYCAGRLNIHATLTVGRLTKRKGVDNRNPTRLKYVLGSSRKSEGGEEKRNVMKRQGEPIKEDAKRVDFEPDENYETSEYEYDVEWNFCPNGGNGLNLPLPPAGFTPDAGRFRPTPRPPQDSGRGNTRARSELPWRPITTV